MPAEGDTIVFEVIRKSTTQETVIGTDGNPTIVNVTSVTFIPLGDGGVSVTGSFTLNPHDPDLYNLGDKFDAVFTEQVVEPIPPLV